MARRTPFHLETFSDFPDDALSCTFPITRRHVASLMDNLAGAGVTRVIWGYYGDGHGGWFMPSGIAGQTIDKSISFDQNQWKAAAETQQVLGNPMRVAVEEAHRRGIEVYAYFKPYETGPSMAFAEGSPQAIEWGRLYQIGGFTTWLDPFVVKHPHLRIKRRADDLWPGHETATIRTLRLTKKDDAPTRIRGENLQIWTSPLNYRYARKDVGFDFKETVEPSPREVRDVYGNLVTKKGDPVRVLTLSGLALGDKYVMVTTDFKDGPGDFSNAWDRLLTALDERGREIPGVYATGTAIWFPEWEDFREHGLLYDTGRGPEVVTLDRPNLVGGGAQRDVQSSVHSSPEQKKVQGVIGFARGRNTHLPGALCETEPAVREYWLSCIGETLDAGVDGVELRVENHSCHTDTPEDYGFNDVVLQKVGKGTGDVRADVSRVRGDAYTEFVRAAHELVRSRGKKLRVNLNMDWFRPPHERPGSRRLAYTHNIDWQWRRWIDEHLFDEAMLRPFAKPFEGIFGGDAVAQEMIDRCRAAGIPLSANRYVWANPQLVSDFERTLADERLSGFVLYETWSYTIVKPDGRWDLAGEPQPPDSLDAPSIWKTRAETADTVRQVIAAWQKARAAEPARPAPPPAPAAARAT